MSEPDTLDEGYMTPTQVCDYLQVDKEWLYDQVQAGRFPHAKFGRSLRFNRAKVVAWAREREK